MFYRLAHLGVLGYELRGDLCRGHAGEVGQCCDNFNHDLSSGGMQGCKEREKEERKGRNEGEKYQKIRVHDFRPILNFMNETSTI